MHMDTLTCTQAHTHTHEYCTRALRHTHTQTHVAPPLVHAELINAPPHSSQTEAIGVRQFVHACPAPPTDKMAGGLMHYYR